MSIGTCDKAGCTVADTGICLLSNPDPNSCPHFIPGPGRQPAVEGPVSAAFSQRGPAARLFPAGLELGVDDVGEIMRARYAHVIGVLGSWDAGKTCFLLSLYIMASRGALPPTHIFAGSQTLPGFEARARRLRKWEGGPLPDQLADHTSLADPRQPAFLHISLGETGGSKRIHDLVLTDLPGEWSTALVDRASTANRFAFLRRADGIIVVMDGPLLASSSRHSELQRNKHLMERLVESVGVDTSAPLVLLVSKCDQLQGYRPGVIDEMESHARSLGFMPEVVLCSAFSRNKDVPSGLGVFEAIAKVLREVPGVRERINASSIPKGQRAFLNFARWA